MLNRKLIINAFRPNTEIDTPAIFAGREREIGCLVDAIQTEGSCPVIYGDRGVGKSSLALQLERIALGDIELLENVGLSDRILSESERFVTVYMSCTDHMRTPRSLFQGIINESEGFSSLDGFSLSKEPNHKESTRKIKLKFYEKETKKLYSAKGAETYSSLSLDEKLYAVLETIHIKTNRPILVIIDELDRVENTRGLASFIKNHCGGWLKMVLVGITHNISSLLADHQSIERKIIPVKIDRMKKDELMSIIDKTEKYLRDNNAQIKFKKEAKADIVNAADGFPWFVHMFGQESLIRAYDNNDSVIGRAYVKDSIKNLAANRFSRQFEDLYIQAVRDSQQREIVLRLFSKWSDYDVPLSEIYPLAKNAGVTNPSAYKKDLTQKKCGSVIFPPPHANAGTIRFRNTMFKRYVDLRSSIYSGVKENVDDLWNEHVEVLINQRNQ